MATKTWVGTATPGDWSAADSWSPSGVPVAADDVFLTNSTQAVTAGLNQSAIALNSLTINQSYTGKIGTASTFLRIQASTVLIGDHIGSGSPTGSQRINLDLTGATVPTITVKNSAAAGADSQRSPIRLIASAATSKLFMMGGKVAIADSEADTSTFVQIDVRGGELDIGDGVTLSSATILVKGGTVNMNSVPQTLNIEGGVVTSKGTGAITTITVELTGILIANSSGLITTLNIKGGLVDFSQSTVARVVTDATISKLGRLIIDPALITITNKLGLDTDLPLVLTAA